MTKPQQTLKSHLAAVYRDEIGFLLVRGAGGTVLVLLAGKVLSFITHAILARILGVAAYGQYIYAFSWLILLAIPAKIGLDGATVRFISAYYSLELWGLIRGYLRRSRQLAITASLITACSAVLVVWLIQDRLAEGLSPVLLVSFAILPVNVLILTAVASLRALKLVVQAETFPVILQPLLFVAGISLIFQGVGLEANAASAMVIQGGAMAVSLFTAQWFLHRSLPSLVMEAPLQYETEKWIKTSVYFMFISGIEIIFRQTDILMLGALVGTTDAGIYAVTSRVMIVSTLGFVAVSRIAAPLISQLYAQGRLSDLQRMATMSARGIFGLVLPVLICIVILGKFILGLFGPEFIAGYAALLILAISQLVIALSGNEGAFLPMTGHLRSFTRFLMGAVTLNVLLNALLIPLYGIRGAAIATATSTILLIFSRSIYIIRRFQINMSVLPFWTYKK